MSLSKRSGRQDWHTLPRAFCPFRHLGSSIMCYEEHILKTRKCRGDRRHGLPDSHVFVVPK